jgi:hypothetical protein
MALQTNLTPGMEELSEEELATISAGWWRKAWRFVTNVAIPFAIAKGINALLNFDRR